MFKKILIANRGEIACRIIDTCQQMGVRTVAIYSDIDKNARHVDMADEAVCVGPAQPSESYLNIPRIIEAAEETGAEAIHPGYGFLSENTDFAAAIKKAGKVFIGPSAEAIQSMGEKSTAKALMEKANLPLLTGYHGDNQDPDFLMSEAEKIGYPLLIKASAGGGGKGMRIVRSADEFKDSLVSAKREAQSSFSNDHMLLEKFLESPRHIEVQVFGDTHGNYLALSERDCSIQRRQQKIFEEAPAPGLSDETRKKLAETATRVAESIDYDGAGTIEFLMDTDESFYFMEMNTRLQVEHPVTEMVTGLDLVEWQLCVAAGEELPLKQDEITVMGHAFEARIYAEDPENDFLPATGKIVHLQWPLSLGDGDMRIETGIREQDTVSAFYDPMIAKLVIHGEDREEACMQMIDALHATQLVGPKNNISFLEATCRHESFTGLLPKDLSTNFLAKYGDDVLQKPTDDKTILALAATALLRDEIEKTSEDIEDTYYFEFGWRVNNEEPVIKRYTIDDQLITCRILRNETVELIIEDQIFNASFSLFHNTIALDDQHFDTDIVAYNGKLYLFADDIPHQVLSWTAPLDAALHSSAAEGALTAPMTGRVIALHVAKGDEVTQGQALAVIEAMKMEHTINAPTTGVVANINVSVDMQVNEGVELITLENA